MQVCTASIANSDAFPSRIARQKLSKPTVIEKLRVLNGTTKKFLRVYGLTKIDGFAEEEPAGGRGHRTGKVNAGEMITICVIISPSSSEAEQGR